MGVMAVVFVLGLLVVAGLGALVWRTAPAGSAGVQRVLQPLGRVRDSCRSELGRHGGALAVLLAGSAASVIICWPFGRFARRFQPSIDEPWLRWTLRHVHRHGLWHHANSILTQLGNRPLIKVICVVAAVGFGVFWARQRRGWWVPALVMAATFGFEKFGQAALGAVVHRHVPPLPDIGSFPSGGCARLITVYGMVFYLALLTWPSISRGWRVTGWTVVALLAFVEGYTRVYLIKHWGMDVLGGWLYGGLLLLALMAAASCFARQVHPRAEQVAGVSAGRRAAPATR